MIRRSPRREFFVRIDNNTIRDERLSWKARGLLAYLLSLPDDWRVSIRDLANRGPDGKDSVQTGLAELERTGYLTRQRFRKDDGTFGHDSVVHETPCPDSPDADDPGPETPDEGTTQQRTTQEKHSEPNGSPSEPAQVTRAREGPSTEAYKIANAAIARSGLKRNTQTVARAVQEQIDVGVPADDLEAAVEFLGVGAPLTSGTFNIAVSKFRQARTREREREERERMGQSDLPYVLGPGKGGDPTNYDALA